MKEKVPAIRELVYVVTLIVPVPPVTAVVHELPALVRIASDENTPGCGLREYDVLAAGPTMVRPTAHVDDVALTISEFASNGWTTTRPVAVHWVPFIVATKVPLRRPDD